MKPMESRCVGFLPIFLLSGWIGFGGFLGVDQSVGRFYLEPNGFDQVVSFLIEDTSGFPQ